MKRLLDILVCMVLAASIVCVPDFSVQAQRKSKSTSVQSSRKKSSGAQQKKSSGAQQKKSTGSQQKKTSTTTSKKKTTAKPAQRAPAKKETPEEMRRRQQKAQQEIKLTEEQIRENDRKVKTSLAELNRIDASMGITQKRVDSLSAQVRSLDSQIAGLEEQTEATRAELAKLREAYMKAVKKMRQRRGGASALAFIFAAENFNQAMRRMRYLKQFSRWRADQSAKIEEKVQKLHYETELLTQTRADKDHMLAREAASRNQLASQKSRQDAVVADLKKNGNALRSLLKRKQAEARELSSRINALIAEEQRRQEREREAAAKAEEKRLADAKKKETAAENAEEKKSSGSGKDYAQARKRNPRGEAKSGAAKAAEAGTASTFESLKGRLPRPVAGTFNVTGRFGRHPLPSLPNVEYDNPGIDVECAKGAYAQAIYPGRVSGVYMLPGYGTVVIVSHGSYYTVYGNLSSASVKVGDQISQGQRIGSLAPDPDDDSRSSIHFEVWRNRDKLNPLDWIS